MTTNLQIITPERIVFDEKIEQVSVPTKTGEITILANHESLIASLSFGELQIKKEDRSISMAVRGGVVEVKENSIVILTDIAERVEEISERQAEQARKRAENLLKEKDRLSDIDFVEAVAILEKSISRLKLVKKYRSRLKFRK